MTSPSDEVLTMRRRTARDATRARANARIGNALVTVIDCHDEVP
jgi:hypothetical protein